MKWEKGRRRRRREGGGGREGGRQEGRAATQRKTRRAELCWYASFSSMEQFFFLNDTLQPAELTVQVKGCKSCTMLLHRPLLFLLFSLYSMSVIQRNSAFTNCQHVEMPAGNSLPAAPCSAVHCSALHWVFQSPKNRYEERN